MLEKMLRERKAMEKVKGDRELDKLLSEIPNPQCISSSTQSKYLQQQQQQHYHHHQRRHGTGTSMSRGDNGSSSLSPYGYEYHHRLDADEDGNYSRLNNENRERVVADELGLTAEFQKMNVGDRTHNNGTHTNVVPPSLHVDPTTTARYILAHNNSINNNNNNVVGVDPLLESSYYDQPSNNAMYYNNSYYPTKTDHYLPATPYHHRSFADHVLQHCKVDHKNSLSMYNNNNINTNSMPELALLHQCGIDTNSSSDLIYPKHAFTTMEDNATTLYKPRMRADEPLEATAMRENKGLFPQSVVLMKTAKKLDMVNQDAYVLEDSSPKYDPASRFRVRNCHIGTQQPFTRDSNSNNSNTNKSLEFNALLHPAERLCGNGMSFVNCHPMVLQPTYNSVSDVKGNIYFLAKDQHGCRFLQKKFEEGSYQDVEIIFNEIIDRIVELMMNPFGNYLIQKLLDVCHQAQRMRIVHMVTREPGQLVRISLNTHGTRVVQKLIETLSTQEQISLVVLALEPGFLDLIKDLNGNHVIQRCLQCLSTEDNKFIFDAAAKFCVDIATHRHGCCVLQRCIDHSNGEQRQKLIAEICVNGLLLAQDPFGNYVVQYILEKKITSASAQLVTQFEEHFVHLSMQKFSSHVVEKCLKFYEESRHVIVHELLSVSHFEQVLQDQYANYVIQSALDVTKGPLHDSLVAAVRPHTILRTNPYCKKIFSRGLLKK